MKKFAAGLTALLICGALNFGAAEAAEIFEEPNLNAEENLQADINSPETEELKRHHRPRWNEPPPPPPPFRPGFDRRDPYAPPPPPPPHRRGFGPRDPYGPPPPFRR